MPAKCTDGHDWEKTEVTNFVKGKGGPRTTVYYVCRRCGETK